MGFAKIGKIRMKSGGAEVRLLRTDMPNMNNTENWKGKVVTHARKIGEFETDDCKLCGFAVIGLFSDGTASLGWAYDPKISPIPRALIPAYIEELLRRDIITYEEARGVVNRSNGFEE